MRILKINAKCSDCCVTEFPNGKELHGYPPSDIGIGGGDMIKLRIDIDTGQIVGWNEKTKQVVLDMQEQEE